MSNNRIKDILDEDQDNLDELDDEEEDEGPWDNTGRTCSCCGETEYLLKASKVCEPCFEHGARDDDKYYDHLESLEEEEGEEEG